MDIILISAQSHTITTATTPTHAHAIVQWQFGYEYCVPCVKGRGDELYITDKAWVVFPQ